MVSFKPMLLVIDDEPLLGQTIQLGLEDEFEITLAATGKEALELLFGEKTFQVILCDLSLPDISGGDIHEALRKARPELLPSFVVMTGGAFSEASQQFMSDFKGRVLNKPFTLNELEDLALQVSQL